MESNLGMFMIGDEALSAVAGGHGHGHHGHHGRGHGGRSNSNKVGDINIDVSGNNDTVNITINQR